MLASISRVAVWSAAILVGLQPGDPPGGASEPRHPHVVSVPLVIEETHTLGSAEIDESSGLVASRRHPGVFWTHNDSGDRARFFAITRSGEELGRFSVEGAKNVDWEDIAIDDRGRLYLADVGNNDNSRRDLVVYVVPEPDPSRSGSVRIERVLRFRYADQAAYPDPTHRDFDCEAILHADDALYLFTKHRGNTRTKVYRLPTDGDARGEVALEPLVTLDLDARSPLGVVTAADLSPDGRRVALLTYTALFVYERQAGGMLPAGAVTRIDLVSGLTRQVESLAWDGDAIVFGNEQRSLFVVRELSTR